MSLSGAVALVTGGAGGIGLNAAKHLLKKGLKGIAIADIDEQAGQKANKDLCAEFGPGKAVFINMDTANEASSRNAFEQTIETFGNIDILFNNAGVADERNWCKTVNVNYKGIVLNTKLAMEEYIPKHKCRAYGTILNNASTLSLDANFPFPVNIGSEHAILTYSRSLFYEDIEKTKVKLMVICPGFVKTNFLTDLLGDRADEILKGFPPQSAEDCGKHAADIIEKDKHGSIWISENKEVYEIEMPTREELRKPVPDKKEKPKCTKIK